MTNFMLTWMGETGPELKTLHDPWVRQESPLACGGNGEDREDLRNK